MKHTIRTAAAALAMLTVAGCGTTGSNTGAGSTSATPVATTGSCLTQFHNWWRNGASGKFNAVVAGLEQAEKVADNLGALQAAVASTAADSRAFLADRAPACVPGMRSDLDTALNDFIEAADHIDKGDAADVRTGAVELKSGAAAMQRVAADLSRTVL